MRHRPLQQLVLALVLVVGLLGHLWMQSSHDVSSADGAMAALFAPASSSHHGDDGDQPSEDHAPLCSALPSGDHRVPQDLVRCPVITSALQQWVVGEQPLTTAGQQPGALRQSPRSPDHGVVLVL